MHDRVLRVFIAGEHGQLATALARTYSAHGDIGICAGRGIVDISNRSAIKSAIADFRPDLVVNAAAYTFVDKAEDEIEQAFRINRDGAGYVAEAARAVGVPIIHVSTDYVFDGTKALPYVETDSPNPIGVYGASKLAGETSVARAAEDHIILRTSWICSADGTNFVKTMLRLAGQQNELSVVDDQWGAPTFAADLAQAIYDIGRKIMSVQIRADLTGVYHVANAGETTWCRFARAIMALSAEKGGPSCPVRAITTGQYPTRAKRPGNSRLDSAKLARVFDIRLPRWELSLESCLNQLLAIKQGASK